jgi:hypothetical protein
MLALLSPCCSDEIIFGRVQENQNNLVREINEHKKYGLANLAQGLNPKIVAYSISRTNANGDTFDVLDTDRLMGVSIYVNLTTMLVAKTKSRTSNLIHIHSQNQIERPRYVRQ